MNLCLHNPVTCADRSSSLFSALKTSNYKLGTSKFGFLKHRKKNHVVAVRSVSTSTVTTVKEETKRESQVYDAIVIGSGIGGLVAATQLAVKEAKVLVLEKYLIPGGSSGYYERDGYTFDVGSSVMFGFSDKGKLNLITQALKAVGREMEVIPDPTTVHFHLPNDLSVQVHREYDEFVNELISKFPHEKEGVLGFYGVCWKIFNSLNSLELKSLEEPIYLFGQFFQKPLECLTLAYYLPQNAGDIARKYIKDPQLLSFIDAECFIVSTVNALQIVLNTDLAGPSFFLPMRNGPYILVKRSGIWSIVGVASGGSTLLERERVKGELDLALSLVLRI